ncbi:MAG: DUF1566 domain-containing protein [Candidatus Scalindua sp.]|nr:DUF1566 domain-containing protein [Candidatus Scalindua sp.]
MGTKNSRLFISVFLFISGCIFLVSEGKVQARNLDYYGLSLYEIGTQIVKQGKGETSSKQIPHTTLRSSYNDLSLSQVHSMNNISINKKDSNGFYGHSTINHSYEKKSIEGDVVVIDDTTGLMWHQSGSSDYMSWNSAKDWIRNLNNRGYAGYQDWRLPSLEEAVSLLESYKRNNLYIDPLFHDEQWGIWTGDKYRLDGVWSVYFCLGNVRWNIKNRYVRPVRSLK